MATNPPQEEQAPASPKDIDLGGDVSLVFGPEGCQVRVKAQKALLSMVSSYFRAIFATTFSEGGDVEEGKDLLLSEDEPDAAVNLLKILHMQYTWPIPMSPLELVSLAIVADKYDCVKAIRLSLDALCPGHGARKVESVVTLVVASYLLDYPKLFYSYSRNVLLKFNESMTSIACLEVAQRVPSQVWLIIQSRREQALKQMMRAFFKLMARPCSRNLRSCHRTSEWYSLLTNNFKLAGLDNLDPASKSISQLLEQAESLVIPIESSRLPSCDTMAGDLEHQQYHPHLTTQTEYNEMIKGFHGECEGLCLDCMKAGGKNEGKCRVKHT